MNNSEIPLRERAKRIWEYAVRITGMVLVIPIKIYQKLISPCFPARCKYYPSCSHYAVDALCMHGPVKGSLLAAWRIMRCNPWSRGGVDYVPEKFDFLYYKKKNLERVSEEE